MNIPPGIHRALLLVVLTSSAIAAERPQPAVRANPPSLAMIRSRANIRDAALRIIPGPANQLAPALPGEIVRALPGQLVPPLDGQIVRSLPGAMIKPLPGQIVQALPGQIVEPLPGQIIGFAPVP
jgi:hypothetical protein